MSKKNYILLVIVAILGILGVLLFAVILRGNSGAEQVLAERETENREEELEAESGGALYQLLPQNQEMGFWGSSTAADLGILDENSLNYETENEGQYKLTGIVSSLNFRLNEEDFRLLVRLVNSSNSGNQVVVEIYQNADPYNKIGEEVFGENLFSGASVLEEEIGSFVRAGSSGIQIVSFYGKETGEESIQDYQILSFDGETLGVEWQSDLNNPDPEELEIHNLSSEDFSPEKLEENQGMCYLTNSLESQEGNLMKYRGSVTDYTKLKEALEDYNGELYQALIRTGTGGSKSVAGEYQQVVADEQVEGEILEVRAVFTEQMEKCDDGSYEPMDLGNGMTAWLSNQEICVVMTNASLVTSTNEKIFTYLDGRLIFAYHNEGGLQHRVYYKEDNPFRWSYPTSEDIRDNAFEDPQFISESRKYQEEGYEYYDLAAEMLGR